MIFIFINSPRESSLHHWECERYMETLRLSSGRTGDFFMTFLKGLGHHSNTNRNFPQVHK